MSKQSHKYITDVRSFLWGLESELVWLELYDTRSVAQREGHRLCRHQGHLIVPTDFSSARGKQGFSLNSLEN